MSSGYDVRSAADPPGAARSDRAAPAAAPGVLVLHHRYRHRGGEEAAVDAHVRLARAALGERVHRLERDSAALTPAGAAAGLVAGGLGPRSVRAALRRTGADVVHAHNLLPTWGPRALEAARAAGAGVVLHLHNYRLVCAVATCVDPAGRDCVRCHGRDVRPGVRLGCRGGRGEAAAYAVGIARAQRRLLAAADVVVVPSAAARDRLLALGAPLPAERLRVLAHPVEVPEAVGPDDGAGPADADLRGPGADRPGPTTAPVRPDDAPDAARPAVSARGAALLVARLAPEKGVDVAIAAARRTGRPLVVCGDGPDAAALRAAAADLPGVRFLGRVDRPTLAALRAQADVELHPSRAHETFGLAAAEAMAAGLPVVAADVGALRDLVPARARVPPGDAAALAAAWSAAVGDRALAEEGRRRVAERLAPAVVARGLAEVYAAARAAAHTRPDRE